MVVMVAVVVVVVVRYVNDVADMFALTCLLSTYVRGQVSGRGQGASGRVGGHISFFSEGRKGAGLWGAMQRVLAASPAWEVVVAFAVCGC